MTTHHVFVDTNCFIQLRDLKDLPWREVFPGATEIRLMVAGVVIGELDAHKVSTRARQRDRARLALALIDSASVEPGMSLMLREAPIAVSLVVAPDRPYFPLAAPVPEPSNDERLVAEAAAFAGGVLLTHDTGPRIAARKRGVVAFSPPDDWHLPSEQTDQDRKMSDMKKEINFLRSTKPLIVAGFGNEEEPLRHFDLQIPILPALSESQVRDQARNVLRRNPRVTITVKPSTDLPIWNGSLEHDIVRYSEAYAKYEMAVKNHFLRLHLIANRVLRAQPFAYFIRNDSGITAERLRVEVSMTTAEKTVVLSGSSPKKAGFPKPPKPPSRHRGFASPPSIGFLDPFRQQHKDPISFTWIERPSPTSRTGVLSCDEFRPKRVWEDEFWLELLVNRFAEGQLMLHVEANNLPEPIDLAATFRVTHFDAEWTEELVHRFTVVSDEQ